MKIYRRFLFALLLLTLGACNTGQSLSDGSGESGFRWQVKPFSELDTTGGFVANPASPKDRLIGVDLGRFVSLNELNAASSSLKIRAFSYQLGTVGGTVAYPEAVAPKEIIDDLIYGLTRSVELGGASDRRWVIDHVDNLRQYPEFKAAYGKHSNEEILREVLRRDELSRNFIDGVYESHRFREAAVSAIAGEQPLVFGIQVQGTVADLKAFGQTLNAKGYVDEENDLYSVSRAEIPESDGLPGQAKLSYFDRALIVLKGLELELDKLFAGKIKS